MWALDYKTAKDILGIRVLYIENASANGAVVNSNQVDVAHAHASATDSPDIKLGRAGVKAQASNPSQSAIEQQIKDTFKECPELALAIAKCESQLDYTREGDKHLTFQYHGQQYGSSIGLYQIRTGGNEHGKVWVRTDNVEQFKQDMINPAKNIQAAHEIYRASGNNFNKWTCYLTGQYKQYL